MDRDSTTLRLRRARGPSCWARALASAPVRQAATVWSGTYTPGMRRPVRLRRRRLAASAPVRSASASTGGISSSGIVCDDRRDLRRVARGRRVDAASDGSSAESRPTARSTRPTRRPCADRGCSPRSRAAATRGRPLQADRRTARVIGAPVSLSASTHLLPPCRVHSARISRTVTFCATSVTRPLRSNESCSLRSAERRRLRRRVHRDQEQKAGRQQARQDFGAHTEFSVDRPEYTTSCSAYRPDWPGVGPGPEA